MTESTDQSRGLRKEKIGKVVRAKAAKTIIVEVVRLTQHPLYKKVIRKRRCFRVHDEKGAAKVGDKIKMAASRPISRSKRWRLLEVVKT